MLLSTVLAVLHATPCGVGAGGKGLGEGDRRLGEGVLWAGSMRP